jgi:cell division septation protein DedD
MAGGNFKDTWLIWVILVIAVVVAMMAFSKNKEKSSSAPVEVVMTAPETAPAAAIKPAHSQQDMKAMEAQKPQAQSAVVVPPQQVQGREVLAVQVYSFKDKTRADAALKALKDKGYSAYVMVSDLGARGTWFRVRVGSYSSEADAQKALASITKDFKSGIIVSE